MDGLNVTPWGVSVNDAVPSEFQRWAHYYASLGIPVFPLRENAKEPATAHGCKDATTDPQQIDQLVHEVRLNDDDIRRLSINHPLMDYR